MKTSLYTIFGAFMCLTLLGGCSDSFLERESSTIFTDDEVFSDKAMITSVLATFYGQIDYGIDLGNYSATEYESSNYGVLDEASPFDLQNSSVFNVNLWALYPYEFIRNINIFLNGVRNTKVLSDKEKLQYEAEARLLRAWAYFYMARGFGGMPILDDKVFSINDPVSEMQIARSTEAGIYDYVMSECDFCFENLPSAKSTHCARVYSWVAMALKARAAITAASIAKYNSLITPSVVTDGREVGIPEALYPSYYRTALEAADAIISSKQFALFDKYADRAENFYRLFIDKEGNTEMIWARDFEGPDHGQKWSASSCPAILGQTTAVNVSTPLLNLVEAYEYLDNRDGSITTTNAKGDYIFFDTPEEIFANKDPRLHGTIICNGDVVNGVKIEYQAGQMKMQGKRWKEVTSAPGITDDDGDVITSANGPRATTGWYDNATGFNFHKFLDAKSDGFNPTTGSDVWSPRFRYAEIILIKAEALLELGRASEGLEYLNMIRTRAGLGKLSSYTLDDIEQERRVEFPLEGQMRYWDLKRWRRAHLVWDGHSDSSRQFGLFPYKIKDLRNANNGKWVYKRVNNVKLPNARTFDLKNYYNWIGGSTLANNPKMVKNPFQ